MSLPQVQAYIRHKSHRMTEKYTHFNPSDFGDALKIQAALLKGKAKKPENNGDTKHALTLVKLPDRKDTGQNAQAS